MSDRVIIEPAGPVSVAGRVQIQKRKASKKKAHVAIDARTPGGRVLPW